MQPAGSASNGEVEDYMVDIVEKGGGVMAYPSSGSWSTIAFEDNWPFEGDYDMNDLVMYLRTEVYRNAAGQATAVKISGELAAVGAAYHNGFGIRLPGILRSNIDEANLKFIVNDNVQSSPLEAGRTEAIFIMAYNTFTYADAGEDDETCHFYRAEIGCDTSVQMRFELVAPFNTPVTTNLSGVFDPFLFATPAAWHGNLFGSSPPGRSYEIHLKNQSPTEAFDMTFFNFSGSYDVNGVTTTVNDASDPGNNLYYQTSNGLPWAIEVATRWEYPREYIDILKAYPDFYSYILSEGGQQSKLVY